MDIKEYRIGFIGMGTVASGVVDALRKNGGLISSRSGLKLTPVAAAVRRLDAKRDCNLDGVEIGTDPMAVVRNPKVDIVVELIGGTGVAREVVMEALRLGKPVVTANKALICEFGSEIFAAAASTHAGVFYEASVAGGIPILKALREGLAGNDIISIRAILNGTSNYILSQMGKGASFAAALAKAQEMGYAEADPTLDVDGGDAAHKAAILASLAYGNWFHSDLVYTRGIRDMAVADMEFAAQSGYRIKLLANIRKDAQGRVNIAVEPTLVPEDSPIGTTMNAYNGIKICGDVVGDTMFYGQGAGRDATASAVLADLLEAGWALSSGTLAWQSGFTRFTGCTGLAPHSEAFSRWYIRFSVLDTPKTLAHVCGAIGDSGVSISSISHKPGADGAIPTMILTHKASRAQIEAAREAIECLSVTDGKVTIYRLDDLD